MLLLLPAVALALPPGPALASGAADSHVVIAVIDTGINAYHREFRDPARTAHPSSYLSGYPANARPLPLCVDPDTPGCGSVRDALAHDAVLFEGVHQTIQLAGDAWGPLHYVPGTRIVGAVSVGSEGDPHVGARRLHDDHGHGTAVASVAAGATLGTCPQCLLVIVEGPSDDALAWARDQPWIDIVTNSWGLIANLDWPPPPLGASDLTRAMALQGKTVLFSAGNGLGSDAAPGVTDLPDYLLPGESTYTSSYTGPDWVVTVGATDPLNGQPVAGSARPVDIAAPGIDVRAATPTSRQGSTPEFAGTSASAPLAAGVFGHVLLQARRALLDSAEGPREGEVLAQGSPPGGLAPWSPLLDGELTRDELQGLVFQTARPCPQGDLGACPEARWDWPLPARLWGWSLPAPPLAYPMLVGYGTVNEASRDAAVARMLGGLDSAPPAPRPEADLWAWSDSTIRQKLWGRWEPHGASPAALPGLLAAMPGAQPTSSSAAPLPAP